MLALVHAVVADTDAQELFTHLASVSVLSHIDVTYTVSSRHSSKRCHRSRTCSDTASGEPLRRHCQSRCEICGPVGEGFSYFYRCGFSYHYKCAVSSLGSNSSEYILSLRLAIGPPRAVISRTTINHSPATVGEATALTSALILPLQSNFS